MRLNNFLNFFKPKKNIESEQLSFKEYTKNSIMTLESVFGKNVFAQNNPISRPAQNSYLVYKCINVLSETIPKIPLKFYHKQTGVEVFDSPAITLLHTPNNNQTFFDFLSKTIMFYALYGENFWVIIDNIGSLSDKSYPPSSIEIVDPVSMSQDITPTFDIKGWRYAGQYKIDKIGNYLPVDRVIQIKNSNPYDHWRGLRATDAIANQLGVDEKSTKELLRFYDNFAIPGTVITAPKDSPVTPQQMDTWVKRFNNRHAGAENKYKTAGFTGGVDIKTLGVDQQKQMIIETKNYIRNTVLAVFNVPLTFAGYTEGINRATAEAQERNFWQYAQSILVKIQMTLNRNVIDRFDSMIECRFDFKDIQSLKAYISDEVNAASGLFNMGWSGDDINQHFSWGLPHHKGITDQHYKLFNLENLEDSHLSIEQKNIIVKNEYIDEDDINKQTTKKKFDKIQSLYEAKFKTKMQAFFFHQRKGVIKELNNNNTDSIEKIAMYKIIQNLEDFYDREDDRLVKNLTPCYIETVKAGQQYSLDLIGIEREVLLNQKIINERLNLIKGINDSTFKRIKKEILDGVNGGETIADISARIRGVYNFTNSRSVIIARTETATCINEATLEEFKQNQISMKEWVTSNDGRVRSECARAQAQGPIPTDTNFVNGRATPGAISCRCCLSPVINK